MAWAGSADRTQQKLSCRELIKGKSNWFPEPLIPCCKPWGSWDLGYSPAANFVLLLAGFFFFFPQYNLTIFSLFFFLVRHQWRLWRRRSISWSKSWSCMTAWWGAVNSLSSGVVSLLLLPAPSLGLRETSEHPTQRDCVGISVPSHWRFGFWVFFFPDSWSSLVAPKSLLLPSQVMRIPSRNGLSNSRCLPDSGITEFQIGLG